MSGLYEIIRRRPWVAWVLFLSTVLVTVAVCFLASSIFERRMEAKMINKPLHEIGELESDSSKWASNYPRQYERLKSTEESDFASRECGSVMIDMLERDPRLVVLWAGYAFSRDYNQGRGHFNAIVDIQNTLRTGVPQAATCWTCKSPDVVKLIDEMGAEKFYHGKWSDHIGTVKNPIGCLDCHDPKTMDLRISRPALTEALERQGKDMTKITHQEMRTMVCAQCHVEYYFKGEGKYLTFPWDKGFSVEEMEEYYDSKDFKDWTHTLSKAPMLKAQHPDYELWMMGIHSQRGVSCADCHMPYRREGGVKFTDHKAQSPLNNIANSCLVCHRESEETLRQNVFERQDKIRELRLKAEDLLLKAHVEAKAAWDAGATEEEMKPVLTFIRHAQWRWDFVAASHGGSFHAPLESARILSSAIEKAQEARLLLSKILLNRGVNQVEMPDITSKEKAQKYIGLDMEKFIKEKKEFLKTLQSSKQTETTSSP